jgi:sugar lactone lactonase YvrE
VKTNSSTMKKVLRTLLALMIVTFATSLKAQTFTITTIAGNGTPGFLGDGGLATSAEISSPQVGYSDDSGNVYIADANNNRLRKVTSTGKIYTVAGNGTGAFAGDSGLATAAELYYVTGAVKDSAGNVYVSDFYNNRIRKIKSNGKIYTIAGTGVGSYNGDGIKATTADINHPVGICLDKKGNIYFADEFNARIRKIDTAGIITTVAGNGSPGYTGDNIVATSAELNSADGIAVDDSGSLYIADQSNQRVRKVNYKTGIITTIAGKDTAGYSGDGSAATLAKLSGPQGVAVDKMGNVYIADYWNNRVRMINYATGIITTIAGTGTAGFFGDGGLATSAELSQPIGISIDASGNLFVADQGNARIRNLTPNPTGFSNMTNTDLVIIYPNPSDGKFTLALKGNNEKVEIEIYNLLGEMVCNSQVNAGGNINLEKLTKGVYICKVIRENGEVICNSRIVIE